MGLFDDAVAYLRSTPERVQKNVDRFSRGNTDLIYGQNSPEADYALSQLTAGGMPAWVKGVVPSQASLAMQLRSLGLLDDAAANAMMGLGAETKTALPVGLMQKIAEEATRRSAAQRAFPAQTQLPLFK